MTSDRARHIEELFAAALDWPTSEREMNLNALCQGDESIVSEVMALVEQDCSPDFLKPPGASYVAELLMASDSPDDVPSSSGDSYDEDPPFIARRYQIINRLDSGGFGTVYRAMDTGLGREVAVKVLNSGREGLLAEAGAQAKLKHPAVVDVYDVFPRTEASFRDGRKSELCCIVMEYIDGFSLAHLIRVGELTPKRSAEILAVVVDAVAHAHRQNLLHRDLKPQNILLSRDGHPKVADFGIAVPLDSAGFLPHAGTPAYMSPEQTRKEASTVLSDVWSLGVVLYEMLTRHLPFDSSDPNLIKLIQTSEPRQIEPDEGIPPELERICLKCLNKDPYRRYPSAAALANELRRWLTEQSVDNARSTVASIVQPQLMLTTGPASNPTVVVRSPAVRLDSTVSRENVSVREQQYLAPKGEILSVAYLPGSKPVLLVENGPDVELWDIRTQTRLQSFAGHTGKVECAALSSNGERVLTGGCDKTLRVWSAGDGKELFCSDHHEGWVYGAAFALDGCSAVSGSDNSLRFWNLTPNGEKRCFKARGEFRAVALAAGGRQLFAGSAKDKTLWRWKRDDDRQPDALAKYCGTVRSIACSEDGQRCVFGGDDRNLWLYEEGKARPLLRKHDSSITRVALSSDGQFAVSGDRGGKVFVWNLSFGTAEPMMEHSEPVCGLVFDPKDSRLILSAARDKIVICCTS